MGTYFAFDLETTGVSVFSDRPMQIGYAFVEPKKEFQIKSFYIDPERECSEGARKVHGISDELAKSGIKLDQFFDQLEMEWKEHDVEGIIGINATKFDIPMLCNTAKFKGRDWDFLYKLPVEDPQAWYQADWLFKIPRPKTRDDHMRIAGRFKPKGSKSNLTYLCDVYNIDFKEAHDAVNDLEATILLWQKLRMPKKEVERSFSLSIENGLCDKTGQDTCCLGVDFPDYGRINISIDKIIELIDESKT